MLVRTPSKGLFLSVYVDDIKLAGKKQNIDPMWKVLMKDVHSLTMFIWVALKEKCHTNKDIVDIYKSMFESRICAGAIEKPLCSGEHDANISSWSYDMEGHAMILRTCGIRWTHEISFSRGACHVSSQERTVSCTR